MGLIAFLTILVVGLVLLSKTFIVVHQSQEAVVETMGKYSRTLKAGWHFLMPVVEVVRRRFDMRETLHDFEPTAVITKDNVTVRINAVVYYFVTDSHAAAYKVQNFENAMGQLCITTLRNLFGEMELDEVLNGRNTINARLQGIMDEATHPWGLKVSRVELKEVTPLGEVADAMDKQMVAERTRRAQILEAEGAKRASILQAEGAKESAILRAEGEREVVLIRAKAEGEAAVIAAKAQQEAIKQMIEAFGDNADEKYLQLRYLEALPKMADGRGSTVFVPTQLSQLANLGAVVGEAFRATQNQQVPAAQPARQQTQARPAGGDSASVRIS